MCYPAVTSLGACFESAVGFVAVVGEMGEGGIQMLLKVCRRVVHEGRRVLAVLTCSVSRAVNQKGLRRSVVERRNKRGVVCLRLGEVKGSAGWVGLGRLSTFAR